MIPLARRLGENVEYLDSSMIPRSIFQMQDAERQVDKAGDKAKDAAGEAKGSAKDLAGKAEDKVSSSPVKRAPDFYLRLSKFGV